MTIDEAEQYLIALKHCETCESNDANDCKACEYHQKGSSAKCYDAIDIGIATIRKYKKQERVLSKLRAELHATAEMHTDGDYYIRDEWIDEYFDKYKAESEEDDGRYRASN